MIIRARGQNYAAQYSEDCEVQEVASLKHTLVSANYGQSLMPSVMVAVTRLGRGHPAVLEVVPHLLFADLV